MAVSSIMNRASQFPPTEDANILTFAENCGADDPASTLDDPIFAPAADEFEEQVAEAQEQLETLRRQQEEIERQKAELEQLRIKQAEFQRGRVEMIENLQHSLDVFERETFEAEQKVEQFGRAREAFGRHLQNIANLRPETWSRSDLKTELDHACLVVSEGREEYERTLAHLDTIAADLPPSMPTFGAVEPASPEAALPAPAGEPKDFSYWLRSGLAFTLPIMAFGLFAMVVMLIFG